MDNEYVSRSRITKLLHLLLALAVVHQLVISLVMQHPEPGRPEDPLFELHEWVGIVTLGIVAAFFVWSVVRRRETGFGMLFPWFSGARVSAVWRDVKVHASSLRHGRILLTEESPMASAVHGLGLLVAAVMAVTGAAGYFIASARPLLSVHELWRR